MTPSRRNTQTKEATTEIYTIAYTLSLHDALPIFSLIVLFDTLGILGGFGIALLVQDVSFALLRSREIGRAHV